MKFLASTLVLAISFCSAIGQNTKADQYNYAYSGINLRSKAQVNSRVITRVPYGAKVQFLDSTGVTDKLGWVEDEWVKVRFRGRDGFVFGGYLLPYEAPDKDNSSATLSRGLESFALANKESAELPVKTADGSLTHYYTKLSETATLDTEADSGEFSAELVFSSTDLIDGYIILEAIAKTNGNANVLDDLRFIKGKNGQIRKISNAQKTILISRLGNDQVSVKLTDYSE